MPCIMRWPGNIPAGTASAEMAATLDLYRTFVALAGGKLPSYAVDGHDLSDFLTGKTEKSPRDTFFYFVGNGAPEAVRKGQWKLRVHEAPELFDLELDPYERYNRAADKPEIVADLQKTLDALIATLPKT
jgi:arylsulfatase